KVSLVHGTRRVDQGSVQLARFKYRQKNTRSQESAADADSATASRILRRHLFDLAVQGVKNLLERLRADRGRFGHRRNCSRPGLYMRDSVILAFKIEFGVATALDVLGEVLLTLRKEWMRLRLVDPAQVGRTQFGRTSEMATGRVTTVDNLSDVVEGRGDIGRLVATEQIEARVGAEQVSRYEARVEVQSRRRGSNGSCILFCHEAAVRQVDVDGGILEAGVQGHLVGINRFTRISDQVQTVAE